ncbi:hypothetical protein ACFC08_17825 [Streptomyces sp. NPDC056112]|uniref:hypothetical protein n=1 Tax=Streptomyces sp. NPDC056112 TaxID=3345715 RepID=UPI0035E273FE
MHSYAVNALIEFPHNGSHGRATRNGHIDTVLPTTGEGLRAAIAVDAAEKYGCAVDEIDFVEFVFTEIPTV